MRSARPAGLTAAQPAAGLAGSFQPCLGRQEAHVQVVQSAPAGQQAAGRAGVFTRGFRARRAAG